MAAMLEFFVLFHNLHFTSSMANFGIGSYLYVMTMAGDIEGTLSRINESAKKKRNRISTVEKFTGFIELESTAKKLSPQSHWHATLCNCKFFAFRLIEAFSELYKPMLAVLFLWSLITISGALLLFQMGIVEYPSQFSSECT